MVAIVTLRVNNCNTGSALSGAAVTDGYATVYTNAYGEISVAWDNTIYAGYSVLISRSGYQSRQINLYNSQNGTTVTTCLNPSTSTGGGSSSGGGGGIRCFIVTAATGSPQSVEVQTLRNLRDEVAARAPAAGALIDAVYDEYWQFSPKFASRIDADGLLREGVLIAAVRPLLAWYGLSGALALQRDASEWRDKLVSSCAPVLPPLRIARLIGQIRADGAVPDEAPQALRDVADHLVAATRLPLVDWAILWPLEASWRIAAGQGDPDSEMAAWLEAAPAEPLLAAGQEEAARAAGLLGFAPEARARLLERLRSA